MTTHVNPRTQWALNPEDACFLRKQCWGLFRQVCQLSPLVPRRQTTIGQWAGLALAASPGSTLSNLGGLGHMAYISEMRVLTSAVGTMGVPLSEGHCGYRER